MTPSDRPDPDALLARAREEEARAARGRLKIYLGASPGVGKTYTMLEGARLAVRGGRDVVIGVVETHGRAETAALVGGLEQLPPRDVEYGGRRLQEFDVDAALVRHPGVLLVDELAHTNAPGSRHAKRWQDVSELLDAGIDVHTTMNIQHVESLNDVVAQITGVTVRETVPDAILDEASELELVDVSPDVLLERLRAGKVYVPDQAARALEQFFRRGNLIALRELALRRTAERVDADMLDWRAEAGIAAAWPAGERVLIAVAASPSAAQLVRSGRRIATALRAECIALHVETAAVREAGAAARDDAFAALRLAESLGIRTVTLTGIDAGTELVAWARQHNVTRIIIGRSRRASLLARLRRSPVDVILGSNLGIDVHLVAIRDATATRARKSGPRPVAASLREYLTAISAVAAATVLGFVLRDVLSTADIAMVFLLGVGVGAMRASRRPAVVAAVASIAIFDFVFVPPYYTFAVSDSRYILTFGVMLGAALGITAIMARIRDQADAARARERHTAALLAVADELASAITPADVARAVARRAEDAGDVDALVLLEGNGSLVPSVTPADPLDPRDLTAATWAHTHRQPAGVGTTTLPAASSLWLPLAASDQSAGALGLRPHDADSLGDPSRRQLFEAIAGQAGAALDRLRLANTARQTQVDIEAERLRSTILSSLSHDLRTPLAAVQGAASTLLSDDHIVSAEVRRTLLETIMSQARRMSALIGNLLDMMRAESDTLQVQREWQAVDEVIGMALLRVDALVEHRTIVNRVEPHLPMIRADGLLLEQVMVNLLENSVKYAPEGDIEIGASLIGGEIEIAVADRGVGVPQGDEAKIFEKFYRVSETAGSGVGLGLAICRAIITAHGGRIWAERRDGGGLRVVIRLAVPAVQPEPVPEAP